MPGPNDFNMYGNPTPFLLGQGQHLSQRENALADLAALLKQAAIHSTKTKQDGYTQVWGGNLVIKQTDYQKRTQVVDLRFEGEPRTINVFVTFRDQYGCFIDNPTNAEVRAIWGSKNGGQDIADLAAGSHTLGGNYLGITIINNEAAEVAIGWAEVKVTCQPGEGPISYTIAP